MRDGSEAESEGRVTPVSRLSACHTLRIAQCHGICNYRAECTPTHPTPHDTHSIHKVRKQAKLIPILYLFVTALHQEHRPRQDLVRAKDISCYDYFFLRIKVSRQEAIILNIKQPRLLLSLTIALLKGIFKQSRGYV